VSLTGGRVTTLSDAELDRELAQHGLDPKAIRAQGAAIGKRLAAAGEEPLEGGAWVSAPPIPIPARAFDRRWVLLAAAALALVGVGGGAIALRVFNRHDVPTKDLPDAAPSVTVRPQSAGVRGQAKALSQVRDGRAERQLGEEWLAPPGA
jgi:hypothetical protein